MLRWFFAWGDNNAEVMNHHREEALDEDKKSRQDVVSTNYLFLTSVIGMEIW